MDDPDCQMFFSPTIDSKIQSPSFYLVVCYLQSVVSKVPKNYFHSSYPEGQRNMLNIKREVFMS